ncbi:unnamed protein product [Ectocarpus sp. 4 AP-2014]
MRWIQALGCIVGLTSWGWYSNAAGEFRLISHFPQHFSVRVQVTSHMVDPATGYPPWIREMDVAYDRAAGRAKVVVTKGLNAGKTFLRLYGSKREYMIRDGEYPACRRSYLGEEMPTPELPRTASFKDMQVLEGLMCEHWVQDDGVSRVHIYIDSATQAPRRLREETVHENASAVPLVTYDFMDLNIAPQAPELFLLPEPYIAREACDLHVGGFPYLHLFHHYLRV